MFNPISGTTYPSVPPYTPSPVTKLLAQFARSESSNPKGIALARRLKAVKLGDTSMKFFLHTLSLFLIAASLGCQSTGRPTAPSTARQTTSDGALFKENLRKAKKGDAEAQYCIGKDYANGRGATRDLVEAVKWYRKAAEQGNADAQNNLGACYYAGEGVD